MKKLFKYFGYGALSLVIFGVLFAANLVLQPYDKIRIYLSLGPEVEVRMNDGLAYRDFKMFLVCSLFASIKFLRSFVKFLYDFFVEFINFLLIFGCCLDFHICDLGCKFVKFINHLLDIFR